MIQNLRKCTTAFESDISAAALAAAAAAVAVIVQRDTELETLLLVVDFFFWGGGCALAEVSGLGTQQRGDTAPKQRGGHSPPPTRPAAPSRFAAAAAGTQPLVAVAPSRCGPSRCGP